MCLCCQNEDEVTTMYEYFRALHQRFFREPDHADLYEEIEGNRKVLAEKLTPEDRKRLLRKPEYYSVTTEHLFSVYSFGSKTPCERKSPPVQTHYFLHRGTPLLYYVGKCKFTSWASDRNSS